MLVLFDIDGTLLDTGGAGKAALAAAMHETFPEAVRASAFPDVELAGSTDSSILRETSSSHLTRPSDSTDAFGV